MDDPGPFSDISIKLILLFVLILINSFFAMSEIAIISLNDNKIKKMAEEGHKKSRKILKLTENSAAFLSTIQIGVTLAGFLASASAAQSFSVYLEKWLKVTLNAIGIQSTSIISGLSLVIITIFISYFSLVLGELAPKRIAMKHYERISFAVVDILLFIKFAMKPFIAVLSASTNLIVRIFGIDPKEKVENVTEEEIRMLVDVGEESGVIEESQKEMINNIFEFDDITAEDIMTHRTDVIAVEIGDPIKDAVKVFMEEGRSRLPVYEDDLDNIVGILYFKDLIQYIGQKLDPKITVSDKMREAFFIPESKKCGSLFTEMTEKHIQMAIVVDEYGGTAGIVTLEDLVETILGNIQDEFDNEDEEIEQISENIFYIDGVTDIEEVSEILDRTIPEGDYDTLAGLIMANLGYIPSPDEHPTVKVANVAFTVESLDEKRIDKVKAEKLPIPQDENDDDKE